jgi:hypothetical protein
VHKRNMTMSRTAFQIDPFLSPPLPMSSLTSPHPSLSESKTPSSTFPAVVRQFPFNARCTDVKMGDIDFRREGVGWCVCRVGNRRERDDSSGAAHRTPFHAHHHRHARVDSPKCFLPRVVSPLTNESPCTLQQQQRISSPALQLAGCGWRVRARCPWINLRCI